MLKTYDVTCPDCLEDFEVDMEPATEEECVECPECLGEFDWEHDEATDTVALFETPDDEGALDGLGDEPDDEGEDELA
jgi:hypothetical protein